MTPTTVPLQPVILCHVMLGDWELVIEKDGDHFAATVSSVFAGPAGYRSFLQDTWEKAIESACAFVLVQSGMEIAKALSNAATVVINENNKRGDV